MKSSVRECDEDLMIDSRDRTTWIVHLSANASSDFIRLYKSPKRNTTTSGC